MASGKLNDKDLAEIHALAKQWGKIVVRRAFGDQGPGLDIDLDCMEQVAAAAAAGLTAGALEEAARQQAQRLPAEHPGPGCGRLCPSRVRPRPVVVKGGQGRGQDEVARLRTLAGPTFEQDPQPDPPACFLDPDYVEELVQDLKSHKRLGEEEDPPGGPDEPPEPAGEAVPVPPDVAPGPRASQQAAAPVQPETAAEAPAVDPDEAAAPTRRAVRAAWPPERLV